jgi:hypothetical protein
VTGPRRFDPSELGADRPDEFDAALAVASWLDAALDSAPTASIAPSAAFSDRVMSAIGNAPAPSSMGFMAPVRRRGFLSGFWASVRQAWASIGEGGRPVFARATALAYVLAVVIAGTSLAGVATVGIAGALGMLGPTATQSPAPPTPGPISSPAPFESPVTESPQPTPDEATIEPSETPDSSDDHGGGGIEPSDDHGGGGPDSSDDHGGGGPEASDDHGGGEAEASDDHGGDEVEPSDDHNGGSGSDDDSGSGSGSGSRDSGADAD